MPKLRRKENTPPSIEHIEIDERHIRRRIILLAVLLAVAALAFGAGIYRRLHVEAGWTEIVSTAATPESVAGDLTFLYELEAGTSTATYRELTLLYNEACTYTYKLFDPTASYESEEIFGLGSVLQHVNEVVSVDETLYNALSLATDQDARTLYLGPIYEVYDSLFYSLTDEEAALMDPEKNAETAKFCKEVATYAGDPAMIDLELLPDHQVCLHVAKEYQTFAEENGFYTYLDFYWMRNAFVVDYIANQLADRGLTKATISSNDGYARSLDDSGTSFTAPIYKRVGQTVTQADTLEYDRPIAIVSLHDYPVSPSENDHYYEYADGEIRTPFVDPADGICRTTAHDLFVYSFEGGCAELLFTEMGAFL